MIGEITPFDGHSDSDFFQFVAVTNKALILVYNIWAALVLSLQ